MFNQTTDIAEINRITPSGMVMPVHKPLKRLQKYGSAMVEQDTFGIILGKVERKMEQEENNVFLAKKRWNHLPLSKTIYSHLYFLCGFHLYFFCM